MFPLLMLVSHNGMEVIWIQNFGFACDSFGQLSVQ